MPLNLPAALSLFKPRDQETRRLIAPLESTVTSVLTFLRNSFDEGANKALRIIRPVIVSSLNASGTVSSSSLSTTSVSTSTLYATGVSSLSGGLTSSGTTSLTGGVSTPTGIKTAIGAYGYSGSTTAGGLQLLGTANYASNAQVVMPFAGSLVGATLLAYSQVAMTLQTYCSGVSPSEYRYDWAVTANTAIGTYFTLAPATKTFNAGSTLIFKCLTPAASTGFSFVYIPFVELAT